MALIGFSQGTAQALLELIFQNVSFSDVGDATGLRGSVLAGNFYLSLHTSDPDEGGSQQAFEATYSGYARVAVPRDNTHWIIGAGPPRQISNGALVTFPPCVGGSESITHFAVGRDNSGAGLVIVGGSLATPLSVSNGITPEYAINTLTTTLT